MFRELFNVLNNYSFHAENILLSYFLYENCNYFNTLTNSRNTRNIMATLYVTFAGNMTIYLVNKNTICVQRA